MKKILTSVFLGMILILSSIVPASAFDLESNNAVVLGGTVDLLDPSEDLIASDVMTYDELVETIAEDYDISVEEAEEKLLANQEEDSPSKSSNAKTRVDMKAATYRTLSHTVVVSEFGTYKPMVRWYVETSEGGGYWGIVRVMDTTLVRAVGGVSKQFSGSLYSHLETAYRIYFYVNGDFFNNGTTTVTGNNIIKVGDSGTLGFTIAKATNFFGYLYYERTLNFQK